MLTQLLENLLNRNLRASPRARELCEQLRGRSLALDIEEISWSARIASLGTSLQVTSSPPAAAAAGEQSPSDARVRGTLVNLLALLAGDTAAVIQRGAAHIEGDAELAQQFQELCRLLRPDLEEELSQLIGDSPAHRLMQLAHSTLSLGRRAAQTNVRNLAEYLAYEQRDLVPRAEADQFLGGVDRLREDVDRLEKRIELLASRGASGDAS
jgi:ubiquinone biosynthesis protein UbiJ